MANRKSIDMTVGKPLPVVIRYSMPLVLSSLFQALYNTMDSIVVGRFVGANALAAVGATSSVQMLLLMTINCLSGAFTVLAAQAFGAKKEHLVRKVLICSLYILAAGAMIMFFVGNFLSVPIMKAMQADEAILADSARYLRITIGLCGGELLYGGITSILRAAGDSKTPLYFLIVSSILNVLLNLLFVVVLHMGVAGVAWATVISQHISAVIAVVYSFWKYPILRFGRKDLKPDRKVMKEAAILGLAGSVQSFANSIGEVIISARINSFGASTVAAFAMVNQVVRFAIMTFSSLSNGTQTFAGQNLGAGLVNRVKEGFKKATLVALAMSGICMIVMITLGKIFLGFYISKTDPNYAAVLEEARRYLTIYSIGFPFLALIWMFNRTLTGLGMAPATMVSGLVEIIFKLIGALILPIWIGTTGLMMATPSGWVLGIVPSAVVYFSGRWEKKGNRLQGVE